MKRWVEPKPKHQAAILWANARLQALRDCGLPISEDSRWQGYASEDPPYYARATLQVKHKTHSHLWGSATFVFPSRGKGRLSKRILKAERAAFVETIRNGKGVWPDLSLWHEYLKAREHPHLSALTSLNLCTDPRIT